MHRLPADRSPSRPSRPSRAFAGAVVLVAAVALVAGCGFAAGTDGNGSGNDGGQGNGTDGGGQVGNDGGGATDGGWPSDGGGYDGGWVSDGGPYDGGWSFDGGAYDGGPFGDGGAAGYPCGDTTCAAGDVCVVSQGGVVMLDGGANTTYACDPYPLACQTVAACSCVGMAICHSTLTDCSGPIPVVTCEYP